MKCSKSEAMIARLVDAELSGWAALLLRKHLARCPSCASVLQQERALTKSVRGWRRVEPSSYPLPRRANITQGRSLARPISALLSAAAIVAVACIALSPKPAIASLSRMQQAMSRVKSAHVMIYGGPKAEQLRMEIWFNDGRALCVDHYSNPEIVLISRKRALLPAALAAVGMADGSSIDLVSGPPPADLENRSDSGTQYVYLHRTGSPARTNIPSPLDEQPDVILFAGDPESGLPRQARLSRVTGPETRLIGRAEFEYNVAIPSDVQIQLKGSAPTQKSKQK